MQAEDTFGPLGLVERSGSGNAIGLGFFGFDPSGNQVLRLTSTGSVSTSILFDSYGNSVATSGSTANYPFGFGGEFGDYTDTETGFVLCQHRFYDPIKCRWINRDPIGMEGGMNLYEYGGDDPIGMADPSGKDFYRWLYTGDWNASDDAYNASIDSVTEQLPIRTPDYYSVNASVGLAVGNTLGFTGQVVVDAYGNVYGGGGASGGYSKGPASVSVTAGYLDQGGTDHPSESDLDDFISTQSANWTVGADGLVIGQTYSPVGDGANYHIRHANEFGFGTPQAGINATYSWKLGKIRGHNPNKPNGRKKPCKH